MCIKGTFEENKSNQMNQSAQISEETNSNVYFLAKSNPLLLYIIVKTHTFYDPMYSSLLIK